MGSQVSNASRHQECCVLVVDDETDIRECVADLLEREGYSTRQAPDGAVALALAHSAPRPSAIVLDLMMPVMNGWQFRERQLADPAIAGIPVIVVSAANGHELKANAALAKPFEIDALLSTVEHVCFDER